MTFRDDHDAALARADAMETEAERAKAERDELAAKVKALEGELEKRPKPAPPEKPKKKPQKKPQKKPDTNDDATSDTSQLSKRTKVIIAILVALSMGIPMALGLMSDCSNNRARDAWDQKTKERNAYRERYRALLSVEDCVRSVAYDAVIARKFTPDKADPRRAFIWPFADRLSGNCLHGPEALAADPLTTAPVRSALQVWLAVQKKLEAPAHALNAYYSDNDWKEDNFASAPRMWAPVLELLGQQVQAFALLRRDAFPSITAELRSMQKAHEARSGRDDTWWRVELALQLRAISDRAYDAGGVYAGRDFDDAAAARTVREQVAALLAVTKDAPIELRRIMRKIDYLTETIASGATPGGETPFWHLGRADSDLIRTGEDIVPALPPDPGPKPEQNSD